MAAAGSVPGASQSGAGGPRRSLRAARAPEVFDPSYFLFVPGSGNATWGNEGEIDAYDPRYSGHYHDVILGPSHWGGESSTDSDDVSMTTSLEEFVVDDDEDVVMVDASGAAAAPAEEEEEEWDDEYETDDEDEGEWLAQAGGDENDDDDAETVVDEREGLTDCPEEFHWGGEHHGAIPCNSDEEL